jgi:acyl dehydratase
MPLDPERVYGLQQGTRRVTLTKRDTILYALGVGYGLDPGEVRQLRYVYEQDLVSAPTMSVVIGAPQSGWLFSDPLAGIDPQRVVHAEQGLAMTGSLPAEGEFQTNSRVVEVIDKGTGRDALIISETVLTQVDVDAPVATLSSTIFVRGGGGFGGPQSAQRGTTSPSEPPEGPPDVVCELPTSPQGALIYRLSGDTHALHVDPVFARAAGFERPLLHGRATFGLAGHAIARALGDYEPASLRSLACRFTGVVYPGESVETQMWVRDSKVHFVSRVPDRDAQVLSRGTADLA